MVFPEGKCQIQPITARRAVAFCRNVLRYDIGHSLQFVVGRFSLWVKFQIALHLIREALGIGFPTMNRYEDFVVIFGW